MRKVKKLNIVLAATGMASLANNVYINEVSRKLKQRGHHVWIVKVNPKKEEILAKNDISVFWPEPKWKWLWVFYLLCPYLRHRSLSKVVTRGVHSIKDKIDVVDFESTTLIHCYYPKENEVVIARGWYYPHHLWQRLRIMWPVGPSPLFQKALFMLEQFWFYWSERWGYPKADALITLTPQLAKQLTSFGFTATWIPLGIEVKKYRIRRRQKPVKFGMVAYDLVNPRKGIRYLLEAAEILQKINIPRDSYQVELVGSYTKEIENEIKNRGLKDNFKLYGRLDHEKIMGKLSRWEIFVLPSLFEELPFASVEAAAAGLGCVGWKIDALVASWGNSAILLPKGDTEKLAQALAKLINDPNLRQKLGQKAWQRAKNYFDWVTVVPRLEKVYREALREKNLHRTV